MKNLKILGFIAILALIAFAFIACSTDDTCTCPPGTIRLVGEAPCGGSGCTCETGVAGVRVQTIAVTNRNNVGNFNAMVNEVTEGLSWLTAPQLSYVKSNIKEIRITLNPLDQVLVEGNILNVANSSVAVSIWGTLDAWCP